MTPRSIVFHSWLIFTATGALLPQNDTHCQRMENVIKSAIYPSDWCAFLVLEYIDCPLRLVNNTMVTLSLEQLFKGFVTKAQGKFSCDKVLILLDTWKTLRTHMVGRKITKIFDPYTRLAFFSEIDSINHGLIFDESHLREIFLGALHVYYGHIISDEDLELQDVLTHKVIKFENQNQLEKVIREGRNLLLHPLFDVNANRVHDVNVSLYNCDPFVIQKDRNGTLER